MQKSEVKAEVPFQFRPETKVNWEKEDASYKSEVIHINAGIITIETGLGSEPFEVKCSQYSSCKVSEDNRIPDRCILVVNILQKIKELYLEMDGVDINLKLECRDVIGKYLGDLEDKL